MKTILSLLCFAFALCLASFAHAALYAASAAGTTGELYTLDPATGQMIQDIRHLNDVTGLNYPITGLAFNPITGVLFGSTGNSQAATVARLVTIDPATANVTLVGSYNAGPVNGSGTPSTMTDLAFDSAGNLFGLASIGGPNVYSINQSTGQATLIGSNGPLTSTSGGGLEINGSGTFYGTPTASRFGTYDSTTGVYTDIGNPAKPAGIGAYAALSFDGSVLYGLNLGPGSPPPTHLVTIDPATATVTDIGASLNSLDAIAFTIPEPGTLLLAAPLLAGFLKRPRRGK